MDETNQTFIDEEIIQPSISRMEIDPSNPADALIEPLQYGICDFTPSFFDLNRTDLVVTPVLKKSGERRGTFNCPLSTN